MNVVMMKIKISFICKSCDCLNCKFINECLVLLLFTSMLFKCICRYIFCFAASSAPTHFCKRTLPHLFCK